MGFAKYHEDNQHIIDDRMYYRSESITPGVTAAYGNAVRYLTVTQNYSCYCPICRAGFYTNEDLIKHAIRRHGGGATDFVVLNGKHVKGQNYTVKRIRSLLVYRFKDIDGTITIKDNADNNYTLCTQKNTYEYNVLPLLKTRMFSEIDIYGISEPVTITQYIDINGVTIDRILAGKCKSVFFDNQVSDEVLSPSESLVYLKMLIFEKEDTEAFIDRIGFMDFEKSRDVEELYYYHSLHSGIADKFISNNQEEVLSYLFALLDGRFAEAEKALKQTRSKNNEVIGCKIINSLVKNDHLETEYLMPKYKPVGIVGNIVNSIKRLSQYEGTGGSIRTPEFKELLFFGEYPLISSIIELTDAIENDRAISEECFSLMKYVTPLTSVHYCFGFKDKMTEEAILKDMLKIFKDSRIAKELAFKAHYTWVKQRLSVKDGDLYVQAVKEENSDKNYGFSDSFLTIFPYDDNIRITPLGGEKFVGASCFIISSGGMNIMLDCGIDTTKYGDEAYPYLDEWNNDIDMIVITHAHLDHCGGITKAHAMWPEAEIIMTSPTKVLLQYLLSDMARVKNGISDEFEIDNLLIEKEVMYDTLNTIRTVAYEEEIKLNDNIEIRLHSAGHIVGAAMVELSITGKSILYTGDFSTYDQMLVSSCDMKKLPRNVDYLITESTYYKRNKVDWDRQYLELKREILSSLKNRNNILLPASSIGRSQELVCILGEMRLNHELPEHTQLIIAGLAIPAVTQIAPLMNERYTEVIGIFEEFDGHNYPEKDSIVIASSGNMSKGSASYRIANFWSSHNIKYKILANGYLDDETEAFSTYMDQDPRVKRISLSTHADLAGLFELIDYTLPKEISFVHRGDGSDYDYRNLVHTCKNRFHGDIICRDLKANVPERIFDIYHYMLKGIS